jgi:hypothetical protein
MNDYSFKDNIGMQFSVFDSNQTKISLSAGYPKDVLNDDI